MTFVPFTLEATLYIRPQVFKTDRASFNFAFPQSPKPSHLLVMSQALKVFHQTQIMFSNQDWLVLNNHLLLPCLLDYLDSVDDRVRLYSINHIHQELLVGKALLTIIGEVLTYLLVLLEFRPHPLNTEFRIGWRLLDPSNLVEL